MNCQEATQYLYSLGNEVLTAKLGLHNMAVLLKFLRDPHKNFRSILIAGTNGKGSVAAFCESILRASGYKTGLYTSPHLIKIEERICSNGRAIADRDFTRLTEKTRDAVSFLMSGNGASGSLRLDRHPTYFEMITAIAFEYFSEEQIDIAVLEVGLGGRLDATNVVDPLLAVITNVDYDHQQYLGNTLEEIAREKAGIIKKRSYETAYPHFALRTSEGVKVANGLPVLFCDENKTVRKIIEKQCQLTGARLIPAWEDSEYEAKADSMGRFQLRLNGHFDRGIEVRLPLPGAHQVSNVLAAMRVMELLKGFGYEIKARNVEQGIFKTQWPGRLEILDHRPPILLDGAHNPAGAQKLKEYIERFLLSRQVVLVYGVMRDKAIQEMAKILFPLARQVILTRPESSRAADPQEIAGLTPEFQKVTQLSSNVREALTIAQELASQNDTLLVAGSLFLIGDAKRCLQPAMVA